MWHDRQDELLKAEEEALSPYHRFLALVYYEAASLS